MFTKHDKHKPRPSLLPPHALLAVTRVLTHGAQKYSDHNWHHCDRLSRYYDAALRHLFAYWCGEDLDRETHEHHLAHAACCVLFLLELAELGQETTLDDRPLIGA